MITINVNIDDLIDELNFPKKLTDFIIEDTVDKITLEIFRVWRLKASQTLHSTRNDYVNNLDITKTGKFSRVITLHGVLPNMIEQGANGFDIKEHFEKSKKAIHTIDKKGGAHWYLTIPYRHGTPGIVGENAAFSDIMPVEVYKIAKTLHKSQQLSKNELPAKYQIPKTHYFRMPGQKQVVSYKHKSPIFSGLKKSTGVYAKTTQNTYVTFRRVSDKSDPMSWIHPGIKQYDLLGKTLSEVKIDIISENNVDRILSENGYGE